MRTSTQSCPSTGNTLPAPRVSKKKKKEQSECQQIANIAPKTESRIPAITQLDLLDSEKESKDNNKF